MKLQVLHVALYAKGEAFFSFRAFNHLPLR